MMITTLDWWLSVATYTNLLLTILQIRKHYKSYNHCLTMKNCSFRRLKSQQVFQFKICRSTVLLFYRQFIICCKHPNTMLVSETTLFNSISLKSYKTFSNLNKNKNNSKYMSIHNSCIQAYYVLLSLLTLQFSIKFSNNYSKLHFTFRITTQIGSQWF